MPEIRIEDLFDKGIQDALSYAKMLELAEEREYAGLLCVKAVEKASEYHNIDLIALFYGEQAYDKIENTADAAKYIFIAKCAMRLYDCIFPLCPAYSSDRAWAVADPQNSDRQMTRFFEWLQTPNKKVDAADCEYFKAALNAMSAKDTVRFKMSSGVQRMTLVEIIRKLVSGAITINSKGELG